MTARRWRAFHEDLPASSGATVELGDEESHHIRRVLRLGEGETLVVFDARGREWKAALLPSDSERVLVRLEEEVSDEVESPLEVVLYQGLGRSQQIEWVIQKATEIGVAAVHPLRTRRSERLALRPRRLERWRRIAVEACKQCGRRRPPRVELAGELPGAEAGTLALVLDPAEVAPRIGAILEDRDGERPGRVLLACGPESGLEEAEIALWCDAGWLRAGLGPRVLRSETAGIVAASIVLHRWADLGS